MESVARIASEGSGFGAAVAFNEHATIAIMPMKQAGSGGTVIPIVALANFRWADSGGNVSVSVESPLSADQQLAYIRRELGISITDLAELLEVARPTIYAWMQGVEPRGEHHERLRRVAQLASEVEASGLVDVGRFLKRPLQDGATLLGLMKAEQPLAIALNELITIARSEARQRAARKGGQDSISAALEASAQSTPGYTSKA